MNFMSRIKGTITFFILLWNSLMKKHKNNVFLNLKLILL